MPQQIKSSLWPQNIFFKLAHIVIQMFITGLQGQFPYHPTFNGLTQASIGMEMWLSSKVSLVKILFTEKITIVRDFLFLNNQNVDIQNTIICCSRPPDIPSLTIIFYESTNCQFTLTQI